MLIALLISILLNGLSKPVIHSDEVTFKSGDITLSGSLYVPKGEGPFPAVVFLHGSGPETRKSSVARAKTFVKNGFVALVFDKRGTGDSNGNEEDWRYSTFETLAKDAEAAVQFLTSRDGVDRNKIGLVAASQSGWVAPIAARRSEDISYLIMISPSISSVAEDRLFERRERLKREGFTETEVSQASEMQILDQKVTRTGEHFGEFDDLWKQNQGKRWFRRVYLSEEPAGVNHEYRIWYRKILDVNSAEQLAELTIPVLCIFGDPELDRFGPVNLSVERMATFIEKGKPFEVHQYLGADHNLKGAKYEEPMFRWLNEVLIH